MKRNILITVITAVLLAAAVITGIALSRPAQSEGGFDRDIIDRVRITVDATQFTVEKPENADALCELEFQLCIQKTEADFYAMLRSADLEGLDYESMIFQTASGDVCVPQDLTLPAENGKPVPVEWTVRVRFAPATAQTLDFSLALNYVSGITQETAEEHVLKIPMQIVVK